LTSDDGTEFDSEAYLADAGPGRTIIELRPQEAFFSQGEPADSVFYLQNGRARVTVISQGGREATITLLSEGEFVGEKSLASVGALHLSTATSITTCRALKIERREMLRVMREESTISDIFLKYLLFHARRTESDILDQLFNSSEKRLARILLSMAEFGEPRQFEGLIPEITEESLAEMIGAHKSSVSFFLNHFSELGLIDFDGRIRVHRALLNAILHDRLPGDNAATPAIIGLPLKQRESSRRTHSHSKPIT
jgi:CRP/FNR family transcriptional regulator, cyclic AMP receptor protein